MGNEQEHVNKLKKTQVTQHVVSMAVMADDSVGNIREI